MHFRVWTPQCNVVRVILEHDHTPRVVSLAAEADGFFSAYVADAAAGTLYRYLLDDDEKPYPDPASRFQPHGPEGPSCVVDPDNFPWSDDGWSGRELSGQILYEMHIGTFTPDGTWAAALHELPELAKLGVTCIEMMPVAEFPGRFSWGYDGVGLFAPAHVYGQPDDLRRFISESHRHGIAVILDVVYNHLGPAGNYLPRFSANYFSDVHATEWGAALNFDGPGSEVVREFILENVEYWIREFHFDGLRVDATQQIFDCSADHIVAAITRRARSAAGKRQTIVIGENEPQRSNLVRKPEHGGYGMDGLWNDDFHHSAMVALTGFNEAYYSDYRGAPQEFVSAAKWGFLFQGQYYSWQKQRRGTPGLDLQPHQFIVFLQNHDQVANSARGERMDRLASRRLCRALTGLLLLYSGTPMLFQGQEFWASSPFLYFADHDRPLADEVKQGRRRFLSQFPRLRLRELSSRLADPADPDTFLRSKLDLRERETHAEVYAMHRDLIRLRTQDPVLQSALGTHALDGAVLGPHTFILRYFAIDGLDRLLACNLGNDYALNPAPEPLLAPPAGHQWSVLWSSESAQYGGHGTPALDSEHNWRFPAHSCVMLQPVGTTSEKPRRAGRHGSGEPG